MVQLLLIKKRYLSIQHIDMYLKFKIYVMIKYYATLLENNIADKMFETHEFVILYKNKI